MTVQICCMLLWTNVRIVARVLIYRCLRDRVVDGPTRIRDGHPRVNDRS
jgi:hypothetical protein